MNGLITADAFDVKGDLKEIKSAEVITTLNEILL